MDNAGLPASSGRERPAQDALAGHAASVIQGASRGVGLALVERLLARDAPGPLFATCRRPRHADALNALAEAHPERIRVLALDVTDEGSIAAAASRVASRAPCVSLLVNCAGVLHEPGGMQPERRLADVDAEAFMRSVGVNALGPLLVAKHLAPLFPARRRAVLANLSARVGSIGDNRLGGWYAYRAAKAAQNMVTRNLAIELRRRHRGILCVALHPGTVDTDLSKPFQNGLPDSQLHSAAAAAENLLAVIDGLEEDSNGRFYAWDGREIPW